MSKGKAFFSTLPGVVSGIAAFVTGIVGLLTVAVQLGWIGGDDGDSTTSTTVTSVAGGTGGTAATGGTGGGSGVTPSAATLSVSPTSIRFVALQAKKQTVTVSNDGNAPVTLRSPEITGTDRAQFSAAYVGCPSPLSGGRTCPVEVTFAPTRAGQYRATLVVTPSGGRAIEVPIEGNHLL